MKQEWVCESCGLNGSVQVSEHANPFSVVYAIENHHEKLAAAFAPHCLFDVHKVRVRNPELMDEFAWNRFVASVGRSA